MNIPIPDLRLGLDVGGTSTRAVLLCPTTGVLARGQAAGGNPHKQGTAAAVTEIARAITDALAQAHVGPEQVAACTIAISGYRGLRPDQQRRAFAEQCRKAARLQVQVNLVHDAVAAFASATTHTHGSVLIAGTGAVAGRISHATVTRIAGGLGWLLGDEGSGHWLGREAVRATHDQLTHLDTSSISTLAQAVLAAIQPPEPTPDALLATVYKRPPAELARLAPLVSHAAETGDLTATHIAQRAAEHLTRLATQVNNATGDNGPLVLAGSVATAPGPIRAALTNQLEQLLDATPIHLATDIADAAARLPTGSSSASARRLWGPDSSRRGRCT
jgi:N-acetylglucosamine kinase-like BadF-type ATPase